MIHKETKPIEVAKPITKGTLIDYLLGKADVIDELYIKPREATTPKELVATDIIDKPHIETLKEMMPDELTGKLLLPAIKEIRSDKSGAGMADFKKRVFLLVNLWGHQTESDRIPALITTLTSYPPSSTDIAQEDNLITLIAHSATETNYLIEAIKATPAEDEIATFRITSAFLQRFREERIIPPVPLSHSYRETWKKIAEIINLTKDEVAVKSLANEYYQLIKTVSAEDRIDSLSLFWICRGLTYIHEKELLTAALGENRSDLIKRLDGLFENNVKKDPYADAGTKDGIASAIQAMFPKEAK
ncbi:hypothetical protein MUP32_02825 [Candidatus Microgenomates bacterium]|nr:hypothetical protein [Candidatus Microgenomates bacterium]